MAKKTKIIKIRELPTKIMEVKETSSLEEEVKETEAQEFSEFISGASEKEIAPVLRSGQETGTQDRQAQEPTIREIQQESEQRTDRAFYEGTTRANTSAIPRQTAAREVRYEDIRHSETSTINPTIESEPVSRTRFENPELPRIRQQSIEERRYEESGAQMQDARAKRRTHSGFV